MLLSIAVAGLARRERVYTVDIGLDGVVRNTVRHRRLGVVGDKRYKPGFGVGSRDNQLFPTAGVKGHGPVRGVRIGIGYIGKPGSIRFQRPATGWQLFRRDGAGEQDGGKEYEPQ